ncbi:hypothetical protein WA026_018195 [Henosepilachna vigintioctopunctata]|uniref:Uncharacterized protein n=1 Tax=Henosepilachna vigintioctopunctata TaxID=420089 RepID=A0AAW1VI38_9CUCU
MPVPILDRIPLPNLRAYTAGSVLALSICVYLATQTVKDPNWDSVHSDIKSVSNPELYNTNSSASDARTMRKFMSDVFTVLVREPFCVWVSN